MKKLMMSVLLAGFQFSYAQFSRNVGEFSSLKVYDKMTVVLIPSAENKVESSSSDSDVETVNKNGELRIKMTPPKILQGDQVSVNVFYQTLTDIQASQGSKISSPQPVEARMLTLTSNEGSAINLAVQTSKLNGKANSGGEIQVTGRADHQDVLVNAGAKFLGQNVVSLSATVTANAGGIAAVNAEESVDAKTRAGGIIDVYGDPEERRYKNIIGGKITFK